MNRRELFGLAVAGVVTAMVPLPQAGTPVLAAIDFIESYACPSGVVYFFNAAQVFRDSPRIGSYVVGLAKPEGY